MADFLNIKNLHLVKNSVKIIRQANDWKRTLEEDIFNKHWLSKLYTELLKESEQVSCKNK